MKHIFLVSLLLVNLGLFAQELFIYSEPASNMAAKSIGLRVKNQFLDLAQSDQYDYYLQPEIMWGISKKVMLHAEGFFSDRSGTFKSEGTGFYGKYRFYSQDEIHSHFRMALTGRYSYNIGHLHDLAIDLEGHNSGFALGWIGTTLIQKTAISSGISFLYATDNGNGNKFYFPDNYRNALNYNLSIGKLFLPKEYVNYDQVNLNGMLECMAQTNLGSGQSYIDLAPGIQFIFKSRMRVDLGYRFPVLKDLNRLTNGGGPG